MNFPGIKSFVSLKRRATVTSGNTLALGTGLMTGLSAVLLLGASIAHANTKVPFALDWKFEGPSAGFFAAIDNGHFEQAGLDVEISPGQGSLAAIPKVATGEPPFAVVGRKSQGIEGPEDLEGSVLGAPPPDGAWAQFPAFATAAGIDMDAITVEPVGFPTREPMLAEGKVDAVTGFSFSSFLNLVRLGVDEDDISTILMADHGLQLYGNAIIVNTEFAEANPDVVKGFLAGVAAGWKDVIADPAMGAEAVIARNPAADAELEQRRLQLAIDANVVTEYTSANGMGGIDPQRMEAAIEQLQQNFEFQSPPDIALYFDDSYLPEGNFILQ